MKGQWILRFVHSVLCIPPIALWDNKCYLMLLFHGHDFSLIVQILCILSVPPTCWENAPSWSWYYAIYKWHYYFVIIYFCTPGKQRWLRVTTSQLMHSANCVLNAEREYCWHIKQFTSEIFKTIQATVHSSDSTWFALHWQSALSHTHKSSDQPRAKGTEARRFTSIEIKTGHDFSDKHYPRCWGYALYRDERMNISPSIGSVTLCDCFHLLILRAEVRLL